MAVFLCTAMVFSTTGCSKKVNIPDAYKLNSDVFGLMHSDVTEISQNHLMTWRENLRN